MFFPVEEWLPAFLLTLVVELVVVLMLLVPAGGAPVRVAVIVLVANLATHAVAWFVLTQVLLVGTLAYTVVVESWAIALEVACYWAAFPGVAARRVLAAAVTANLASFVLGLAIGMLPLG
jgi:hypothetical protein